MNQIVIVTGGTKGIGFATAKKFLSCGDKVIVLGRHETPEALETLNQIGEATFIKADVSVVEDCQHVIATAMEKYGKIDVLANVAGVVGTRGAFVDLDLAGGQVGIECYLDKIQSELSDTMYMCGARKISDITSKMVRVPKIW